MKLEFDLKNHIALTSTDEMSQICSPLKHLGITYFTYFKIFKDGSHIRLSNHGPWTEHYYNRKFYNVIVRQVPSINGYILWSCLDKFPIFHEAAEHFDVDNGVVLVDCSGDIVERYFFGSTRDNTQIKAFYSFNVEWLNRFVLYFKDKAAHLIDESIKQKICIPKIELPENKDEGFYSDPNVARFLSETEIKRYCVNIGGQEFYLPEREAQVLALLKRGDTAKEMAQKLNVSHRTVEGFKDSLRTRLQEAPSPQNLKDAMKNRFLNTTNLLLDEKLPAYLPLTGQEDG